jgi:hypothetical protein
VQNHEVISKFKSKLFNLFILLLLANSIFFVSVARERRRGDRPPSMGMDVKGDGGYISGKYGETRNSLSLSSEKRNGSRHLVFWSLGTLTGLRDWVRGLVA